MYKMRIKQWKLDKKNKESDMRAIVRKKTHRAKQGKASAFRVRGRNVDFEKLLNYWHRKGKPIEDVINLRTASMTPEAVECLTPIPSRPTTPDVFSIPERIFQEIKNYYIGSFESGNWISTSEHLNCSTTKVQGNAVKPLSTLYTQCQHACQLFNRDYFQDAGQALICASAVIKQILQAEHPQTLSDLVSLILLTHYCHRKEVGLSILRQFSALGAIVLGDNHPLRCICAWLTSVDQSQTEEILTRCLGSAADHFEKVLGPMHRSTLCTQIENIKRVILLCDTNQADKALQKLLVACDRTLDYYDVRILDILLWLGCSYVEMGAYGDAEITGRDVVARARCLENETQNAFYQSQGLYILANAQNGLGQGQLAEKNLRQAIDLRVRLHGKQDGQVGVWLLLLGDWLVERGDFDAAAEVQRKRKEILEAMIMYK